MTKQTYNLIMVGFATIAFIVFIVGSWWLLKQPSNIQKQIEDLNQEVIELKMLIEK